MSAYMLEKRQFIQYNKAMVRQFDLAEITLVIYFWWEGGECR